MALTDILLDIEGTTSSVTFVHDVLFPYAKERLPGFVRSHGQEPAVRVELERARGSLSSAGLAASSDDEVVAGLLGYLERDVKDTALKALQGMIWRFGYENGAYRAHMYPDVPPALARWQKAGLRLSIYSSGSIQAQKLFFAYSEAGDLTPLLHAHFDTTTGGKKEAASYAAIANALDRPAESIAFLSDIEAELDAARVSGLVTYHLLRDGPAPSGHPAAATFDEVERGLNLL